MHRGRPIDRDKSTIRTPRLELVPWTLELVDAFIANDQAAAEQAFGVRYPEPFGPPPETGDILHFFRDSIEYDASNGAFVVRMIVRTEDRMAIGNIGLIAPNEDGRSMYGYSVYPESRETATHPRPPWPSSTSAYSWIR